MLESVYETVLEAALRRKGMNVARQLAIDIDLLVEERLIIEIKSVEKLGKAHAKQMLTYLRLTKQPVGLLLNFSEATMMDGVIRLVNDYRPET